MTPEEFDVMVDEMGSDLITNRKWKVKDAYRKLYQEKEQWRVSSYTWEEDSKRARNGLQEIVRGINAPER